MNFGNIRKNYDCNKTYNQSDLKYLSQLKGYIFCEHINVKDLLAKNTWEITEIRFNLPENFTFENFKYYKYIQIKDEMIYILGIKNLLDQKLKGISFNIENKEFTLLDEKILKKLDVLRTSFKMASDIVEYQDSYFYFNFEKNAVERLTLDQIFA